MRKKKRIFTTLGVCLAIMAGGSGVVRAAVSTPELTIMTNDTRVQAHWSEVEGASGYTLYYVAIPYTGGPIESADMGDNTSLSIGLWPGASYAVAVKARDGEGESGYSNIEDFHMPPASPSSSGKYQVFAFNDLGMHCYDPDFSVFSLLPPFNVLHAQVVRKGNPPSLVGNEVEVTYRAMADATGSINTTREGKTNFWDYESSLYGLELAGDEGILGAWMPGRSNESQPFEWKTGMVDWFSAEGIPITAIDDNLRSNPYPLLNIRAVDPASGATVSSIPVVVPVSDEMSCDVCHLTGNRAAANANITWSDAADPAIQYRENILLLHDYRNGTNLMNSQPVLCASCHYSLALDLSRQGPVGDQAVNPTMSAAIHGFHADRITAPPASGNVCFYCHPGEETLCMRGAMAAAGIVCRDCHGTMTAVGRETRQAWIDLPRCESCHTGDALDNHGGQIIRRSAYDDNGDVATFISASNKRFAEEEGTLYRNSVGHGGMACEACHGSPHAIWPSREENDNLTAVMIQGHEGTISECSACHTDLVLTPDGGPHGLHNVNSQQWVHSHEHYASVQACAPCHGANGEGTVLSKAAADRAFTVEDRGIVSIAKGTRIGCGLCHANMLGMGGDDF